LGSGFAKFAGSEMREIPEILMKRFLTLLLPVFVMCCSEEEGTKAPSGLSFEVNVSSDGSGEVTVQATAENARFFRIFFGEPFETGIESTDGQASHTYTESGSYIIVVRAHSAEDKFITQSKTIEVLLPVSIPDAGYSTPLSYGGMSLVWQDEFSADGLNLSDWTFETGTGSNGWGNNELQYYLEENTTVKDGYLIIAAKKESKYGSDYTSSRIITKGKKEFQYGRVDIRAVLPKGQGIWPALWMLGDNISDVSWPKCGEIDIMEMIGGSGREKTIHGTVHWDNNNQYASYGGDYSLASGIFADEFHVFSIVWTQTTITWYMDDIQYHVIDITPAELSEFHNHFFFIFNIAVGGNWPGSPTGETRFPQYMIVDYIRVFQNT
jgi:beta-glucanase (GH16 family)